MRKTKKNADFLQDRAEPPVGAKVAQVGLGRGLPSLLTRDFRAREQTKGECRLAIEKLARSA